MAVFWGLLLDEHLIIRMGEQYLEIRQDILKQGLWSKHVSKTREICILFINMLKTLSTNNVIFIPLNSPSRTS